MQIFIIFKALKIQTIQKHNKTVLSLIPQHYYKIFFLST